MSQQPVTFRTPLPVGEKQSRRIRRKKTLFRPPFLSSQPLNFIRGADECGTGSRHRNSSLEPLAEPLADPLAESRAEWWAGQGNTLLVTQEFCFSFFCHYANRRTSVPLRGRHSSLGTNKLVCWVCLSPFEQQTVPLRLFIPEGSLIIQRCCGSGVTGLLKCWSLSPPVDVQQVALRGLVSSYNISSHLIVSSVYRYRVIKSESAREVVNEVLRVCLLSDCKDLA